MSNLCNPYRLPPPFVAPSESRFVTALYQTENNARDGKAMVIPAGTLPDTRKIAGTCAFKFGIQNQVGWPRFFSAGTVDWTTSAIRWGCAATTGEMFMQFAEPDTTAIYNANTGGLGNVCDGVLRRFAFILDLDDIANSHMWVDGVNVLTFTGSPTGVPLPFASSTKLGIYTDMGGTTPWASNDGDGLALFSFSMTGDLNIAAVFDGAGYFTNPGPGFANWYTTQPEFGYISAPYVNQGSCRYGGGKSIKHTPVIGYDPLSSSEHRSQLTGLAALAGTEVNPGIGY